MIIKKVYLTLFSLIGFVFVIVNVIFALSNNDLSYVYNDVLQQYVPRDINSHYFFGFQSLRLFFDELFNSPNVQFWSYENLISFMRVSTQFTSNEIFNTIAVVVLLPIYLLIPVLWLVGAILTFAGTFLQCLTLAFAGRYNIQHIYPNMPDLITNPNNLMFLN